MTLTMCGRGQRVSVDSHLDGFEALARRVAEAAQARNLTLDQTTESNFAALRETPGTFSL